MSARLSFSSTHCGPAVFAGDRTHPLDVPAAASAPSVDANADSGDHTAPPPAPAPTRTAPPAPISFSRCLLSIPFSLIFLLLESLFPPSVAPLAPHRLGPV